MREPAGRLRLALEAANHLVDAPELAVQQLERHHLLHQGVLGPVDGAHPPLADAFEQAVALAHDLPDVGVDGQWGSQLRREGNRVAHGGGPCGQSVRTALLLYCMQAG
jgi:hypothetical protein